MFYVQYYNNKKYDEKYQEQWELQTKSKVNDQALSKNNSLG